MTYWNLTRLWNFNPSYILSHDGFTLAKDPKRRNVSKNFRSQLSKHSDAGKH